MSTKVTWTDIEGNTTHVVFANAEQARMYAKGVRHATISDTDLEAPQVNVRKCTERESGMREMPQGWGSAGERGQEETEEEDSGEEQLEEDKVVEVGEDEVNEYNVLAKPTATLTSLVGRDGRRPWQSNARFFSQAHMNRRRAISAR